MGGVRRIGPLGRHGPLIITQARHTSEERDRRGLSGSESTFTLPKTIFRVLKKQKPGQNGEIHITDAIRFLLNKNNKFIGHIFAGKYLDCGTMKGYINSTIEISKL